MNSEKTFKVEVKESQFYTMEFPLFDCKVIAPNGRFKMYLHCGDRPSSEEILKLHHDLKKVAR